MFALDELPARYDALGEVFDEGWFDFERVLFSVEGLVLLLLDDDLGAVDLLLFAFDLLSAVDWLRALPREPTPSDLLDD